MKNWQEILTFTALAAIVAFGIYVGVIKNFNAAGIGSYSVVVTLSETDRQLLRDIREALKK